MKKIVIDTLGGDLSLQEILEGVLLCYQKSKDYKLVLVGPKRSIDDFFDGKDIDVEVVDALTEVTNHTNPTSMLYEADDTALVKSYKYLKSHDDAIGLITCSATGCVLVGSIFHLGLVEGLRFPVLGAILKHQDGEEFLLADCGANIDVKDTDVVRFARLGSEFMGSYSNLPSPRVGIVSNGKEDGKGNTLIKAASALLKEESSLNFVGNVEASDVFDNKADVIVCDGMIGNVILKVAESVAKIVASKGDDENINQYVATNFDYNNIAGSVLIGANKLVVKAHGAANRRTIAGCFDQIVKLSNGGF